MFNSSNIITGERIQQKCDIYLGNSNDFNFNPKISLQKEKQYYLESIHSVFDNPYIIFCYSHHVSILVQKIMFFLNPFILITHNSDHCITQCSDVMTILNYDKLEKWYAQNICFDHEKLYFLPIGLANSMWKHGDLSIFDNVNIMNNLINKTKKIYFYFTIGTNQDKRQICYDQLKDKLEWLPIIEPN
jgi:hypothetical protein